MQTSNITIKERGPIQHSLVIKTKRFKLKKKRIERGLSDVAAEGLLTRRTKLGMLEPSETKPRWGGCWSWSWPSISASRMIPEPGLEEEQDLF